MRLAPGPKQKEHNSSMDGLAIVIRGNKATKNVATGDYVLVEGSTISGVSDGGYKALSNVSAGTAFTSANLSALTKGAVNVLNDQIGKLENTSLDSNSVDVSGYSSTYYTCPVDGYAWAKNNSGVTGMLRIYGDSGSQYVPIGGAEGSYGVYVKKGMRLRVNGTLTTAEFIPFTST